jgi:hypothetical protein
MAESKACSERRQNPSLHARNAFPSLFNEVLTDDSILPGNLRPNIGDVQLPVGSGTLKQMDSAVSTHMLREDQIEAIEPPKCGIRTGDRLAEDSRGNQMFLDSLDVGNSSEYIRAPDEAHDSRRPEDKSSSSCWRPELPPPGLLDYIRILASQRLQRECGVPDENVGQPPEALAYCLSSSALVAIGILIEELTGEFMVSWRQKHYESTMMDRETVNSVDEIFTGKKAKREASNVRGKGPLGPVSLRSLTVEAKLQLKGAKFFSDQVPVDCEENKSKEEINISVAKSKVFRLSMKKTRAMKRAAEEAARKARKKKRPTGPDTVTPALLRNRLEVITRRFNILALKILLTSIYTSSAINYFFSVRRNNAYHLSALLQALFGQDLSEHAETIDLILVQERVAVE